MVIPRLGVLGTFLYVEGVYMVIPIKTGGIAHRVLNVEPTWVIPPWYHRLTISI